MQDILERLRNSSTNESSHELQCRCMDAEAEIVRLRDENERMTRVIRSFDLGGKPLEEQISELREALSRAADVAQFACEGWREPLMHEGARIAADAVRRLMTPNVEVQRDAACGGSAGTTGSA